MNKLRKAAEQALEALRNAEVVYMEQLNAMYALQEALAQPEYVTEVVAMNENGIYTTKQTLIQKHEWVGLTEQDRNDLEDYCEMIIGRAAFDAIETKLKEKNE